MPERRQRLYRRLDRAERAAIERGLDKSRPARAMARDLGRSQSENSVVYGTVKVDTGDCGGNPGPNSSYAARPKALRYCMGVL